MKTTGAFPLRLSLCNWNVLFFSPLIRCIINAEMEITWAEYFSYSGMVYFTSSLSVRRLAGKTLLEQSNKESFTPAGWKIGISLLMEASHWVPFSYNHKEEPCSFKPVVPKWSIFPLEIMSHWDFSVVHMQAWPGLWDQQASCRDLLEDSGRQWAQQRQDLRTLPPESEQL